jgi:hypothetical protein
LRRSRIYLACGLLAILSLALAASRPHGFQKLNTIVPADGFEPLRRPSVPVDIAGIIGRAPFRPGAAVTVDPAKKYRLTVEEGTGNCSERAFGLAWKLRQSEIDLQIVHLLPQSNFVRGNGHSLIRIPYEDGGETRVGLVDLLEGGFPTSDGELLDIEDLTRGAVADFEIRSLTRLQDDEAPYYGDSLDSVSIGYIPAREIDRYFDFIEWIYVPLGNDRLEKIFYDGLALIVGVLPRVYVPDYESLVREHRVEMWLQKTALWVQRFVFLAFPVVLIFEVGLWFRSAHRFSRR